MDVVAAHQTVSERLYNLVAMSSRIVIYCILFQISSVCFGQKIFVVSDYNQGHTFLGGIVSGMNFSQIDGDAYNGYHKLGFNAAAVIYAKFSDHLGLSTELIYTQKGSRIKEESYSYDYSIKADYVELPIMMYGVPNCLGNKFHFRIGASCAWLVNFKEAPAVNSNYTQVSKIFRRDVNYLADVNYMFYEGLFLNVRYTHSLIPFREYDDLHGNTLERRYHNCISLRLMFLLK
jgi:hypothetical protein